VGWEATRVRRRGLQQPHRAPPAASPLPARPAAEVELNQAHQLMAAMQRQLGQQPGSAAPAPQQQWAAAAAAAAAQQHGGAPSSGPAAAAAPAGTITLHYATGWPNAFVHFNADNKGEARGHRSMCGRGPRRLPLNTQQLRVPTQTLCPADPPAAPPTPSPGPRLDHVAGQEDDAGGWQRQDLHGGGQQHGVCHREARGRGPGALRGRCLVCWPASAATACPAATLHAPISRHAPRTTATTSGTSATATPPTPPTTTSASRGRTASSAAAWSASPSDAGLARGPGGRRARSCTARRVTRGLGAGPAGAAHAAAPPAARRRRAPWRRCFYCGTLAWRKEGAKRMA
jgi:hypothetical protein